MVVTWVAEPYSFLGWAACVRQGCTGRALVTAMQAPVARCGACMAQDHPYLGGGLVGAVTPVVAHTVPVTRDDVTEAYGRITEFPAPEHTSRDPIPLDWEHPSSVVSLADRARSAGWSVRVQYARGWAMHARTAVPTKLMHTVAVRCGTVDPFAGGHAGYALYGTPVIRRAWTWQSFWVWGVATAPHRLRTLEEFTGWLDSPDGARHDGDEP